MKIITLFVLLIASSVAVAVEKPLNVLVLYADDWRHDTLGCAGNPVVKTPHLDRLAGDGLRFTHNYVTTAICGVSRASLFTGQWMSRHGNPAFAMFKTPWAETYPGLLRANGYFTGHIAADPFEENDLASDPAQAGRLAEMRVRFTELKAAAK